MTSNNPVERMARARSYLVKHHIFYGACAMQIPLIADESVGTACTNALWIKYSPSYVAKITDLAAIGLLVHEIRHITDLHPQRKGQREHGLCNEAADYAINGPILAAGFTLPDGALFDPRFAGLTMEQIYAILHREREQAKSKPQEGEGDKGDKGDESSPGSGEGEGEAEGEGEGEGDSDSEGEGEGDSEGEGGGEPSKDSGRGRPSSCGDFESPPDDMPADKKAELARDIETMVRQAVAIAKAGESAGHIPGEFARMLDGIEESRVDWRDELRRLICDSQSKDYTWQRPSNRQSGAALDVRLPGLRSDTPSRLIVAIDTSGSIDDMALRAFIGEVQGLFDQGGVEAITLIACDKNIQSVQELMQGDRLPLTYAGGGGTATAPVFNWLADNASDACAIVYFTDLIVPRDAWGNDPGIPVIWACWLARGYAPPFGDIVRMDAHA